MNFSIEITATAKRDLKKIQRSPSYQAIIRALKKMEKDPFYGDIKKTH